MDSTTPILIEVVASTVQSCIAAERGGADRIELCTALATAGLTPGTALLRAVKKAVSIPVVVMIRPREGDFYYTPAEMDLMKAEMDELGAAGADGFVFGLLNENLEIDVAKTSELVRYGGPISSIFHRAIDCTPDLMESVAKVKQTGCIRILTSGGKSSGIDGIDKILEMQAVAGNELTLMPGGGLRSESFERVLRKEIKQYHLSGRRPWVPAHEGSLFDFHRQETDTNQIIEVRRKCDIFFRDHR